MKKSKLLVVSLLALTLCGCNGEKAKKPFKYCVEEINKISEKCKGDYCYSYTELHNVESAWNTEYDCEYFYKISIFTDCEESVWLCGVCFKLSAFDKATRTGDFFEESELVGIDCDWMYSIYYNVTIRDDVYPL